MSVLIDRIESYLYEPSMSWPDAKKLVKEFERESGKNNVDDSLIKLFEGSNKKNISLYRNKTLLDSVLLCFVWHRIHRGLLWDSSTEVFSPVPEKLEKVMAIIKRVSLHLPLDSPLSWFSKFLVFCIRGEYQRSFDLGEMSIPKGCYLEYYIVGAKTFQLLTYDPGYKIYYRLPHFDQKKEAGDALILLSCDEVYYNKFHEGFITSARCNGVNNTIVFIVVDDQESVFYDEGKDFYKISVTLDYEYSPALYASARFLFVRDVIRKFKKDVFIFDIDFDFAGISPGAFGKIVTSDVGLSFNRYGRSYVPWSNISAAACYFSKSRVADVFLNAFSLYFESAYVKDSWWIDQNSLFYAYNVSRDLFPSGIFSNMIDVRDQGVTNHLSSVVDFKKLNFTR